LHVVAAASFLLDRAGMNPARIAFVATMFCPVTALAQETTEPAASDAPAAASPPPATPPAAVAKAPPGAEESPPLRQPLSTTNPALLDVPASHHGLFFRVVVGPTELDTSATSNGTDVEIQGAGYGFGLAFGGALSRHFVLYGEVFEHVAIGPTIKMNDVELGTADSNVSMRVIGVGPGFAYYSDNNFYVSVTAALSVLSLQRDNTELAHTNKGFGVSATVGKEWWVSDQVGLGLGGQLYLGAIPDGSADNPTWTTVGAMLAFSGTVN